MDSVVLAAERAIVGPQRIELAVLEVKAGVIAQSRRAGTRLAADRIGSELNVLADRLSVIPNGRGKDLGRGSAGVARVVPGDNDAPAVHRVNAVIDGNPRHELAGANRIVIDGPGDG